MKKDPAALGLVSVDSDEVNPEAKKGPPRSEKAQVSMGLVHACIWHIHIYKLASFSKRENNL